MVDKKKQIIEEVAPVTEEMAQPVETMQETPTEMPEMQTAATETTAPTESIAPGETPEETPEDIPATDVLSKLLAIVKRFAPDIEVDETTQLTPEANTALEALMPVVESIVEFHDDFYKVVEEYPEFGDFVIALRNGYAPYEAFVEHLQPEEPQEGAPDYEGSKMARQKRGEAMKQRTERKGMIDKNIEGSVANIQTLGETKGWTPEQTTEFENNVSALFNDWADGNLTMPSLENLANGFAFDTIVKQKDMEIDKAFEDGAVSERNAKISQKRKTAETGDGMPRMTGAGDTNRATPDKFTTGLETIANKKNIL